jgi:FkbM family methyltransferase
MKKHLKKFYEWIPFKLQIYTLLRSVWIPPQWIYQHLHFTGIFTVEISKVRSFKIVHHGYQVENELFWRGLYGGWEGVSLTLWTHLCEDAQVVLDIGANTGVYALVAQTVNPGCRVFAFEPVKRVHDKLVQNVELNHYPTTTVQSAVSESDGTAVIYDTSSEHTYSVTVNKNLCEHPELAVSTEVQTRSLDSFVREYGLDKVDLIKIDVETHEPEVLRGYAQFLPKHRPCILVEILSDEIGEKVEAIVSDLGYKYFDIDEMGRARATTHIRKSSNFNYLLCSEFYAKKLGLVSSR